MEADYRKVWSDCLTVIKEQVSPKIFKTWFEPVEAVQFQQNVLTIQVHNMYVYECLEEHYVKILRDAIRKVIGPGAQLEYLIMVEEENSTRIPSNPVSPVPPGTVTLTTPLKDPFKRDDQRLVIDSQLHPFYTMESFIEGPCNRLAKAAGEEIAKNPGKTTFNPLLIYGASGLGKTHLAQAIGLKVKQNFPDNVVLYVSTNLFQEQFTEAVRQNQINDFMRFYKLVDVLILDDIHELAGKTGTQNTFFHIFNHLHQLGKQLIFTSDRSPAELSGMEERLLSRFRRGLPAEMKAPDFETRMAIVRHKTRKDGIDFPDDVLKYICKYVDNNVRELEGAIITLLAQQTFNRKELTADNVKEILGKMVTRQPVELTVERIRQVICDHFHMTLPLIQGKVRTREVVRPRQIAMYFAKNYTNASLSYIGSQLGKKDHTTVLYSCKVISDLMETDRVFNAQIKELERKIVMS
jgi:chromosomal replication initiator protein